MDISLDLSSSYYNIGPRPPPKADLLLALFFPHGTLVLLVKASSRRLTASCCYTPDPTAMDYSYFSAAPQPYHFMGMPPNGFPHAGTGVDPETIRSIVRSCGLDQRCGPRMVP